MAGTRNIIAGEVTQTRKRNTACSFSSVDDSSKSLDVGSQHRNTANRKVEGTADEDEEALERTADSREDSR